MILDESIRSCSLIAAVSLAALLAGCAPGGSPTSTSGAADSTAASAGRTAGNDAQQPAAVTLAPPRSALRAVPGEFLVKFKAGTSRAAAARAFSKASLDSTHEFRSVPGLHLVRTGTSGSRSAALKATLAADPLIEYIEPNFIRHAMVAPNDPDYPRLWAMHNTGQTGSELHYYPDIGAEAAWDITTGSSNVVVAVIDSGVDYHHEDLAANIWENTVECDLNGVDDDGNGYVDDCHGIDAAEHDSDPMDEQGHGTHVSGTIGAVGNNGIGVAGVAWQVKILPCRFLDASGHGDDADAIECLDYLAALKQHGVNLIASNNSWGGTEYSRALEDAIRAQRDLGILFVTAAGNDILQDVDIIPQYPCVHELANVICVASTYDSLDIFSNFGLGTVLLGAPGSSIYSTVPGNQYEWHDGTSMATPHVTGSLVLLKAQNPARTPWQLRNLLAAGAVPAQSQDYSIGAVTNGRLNVFNSLTCTNTTVLARLRPMTFETLSRAPGDTVTIRALHVRCAAPNGNVSVNVAPGGEVVTLRDNGAAPDEIAGDGIYAGNWVAHGSGAYTFSFPAPETETFVVDVDPGLKPGFPRKTATHTFDNEPWVAHPAPVVVGNIAGDARLEILALPRDYGPLWAWDAGGAVIPGWPRYEPDEADSLVLGNFDGNPSDLEPAAHYFLGTRLYQGDGVALPGWPQSNAAGAAAADIDGDGVDEIISYPARRADGTLFRSDAQVPAFPEGEAGYPFAAKVGDLDADGSPEFVSIGRRSGISSLWISDRDGLWPGFPVAVPGGNNTQSPRRPLIGDVDGDGIPNFLVASVDNANTRSQVQVFDNRGVLLRTLYSTGWNNDGLALADLDRDGIPEIVDATGDQLNVWRGDGTPLPGWPRDIGEDPFVGQPAIGDIDGDGAVDVVAISSFWVSGSLKGRMNLHAFRADGSYLPGFPRSLSAEPGGASPPVIADIDLDGRNDLVVSYLRGLGLRETIFAYDLHGAGPYGPVEWSQESGDARSRGYYETGKNLPNHAYLATQVYGAGRITDSGGGINCRGDCIQRYAKGTNVALTATAQAGGTFSRWRGACLGQGNPCTLPMQRFTETSADFASRLAVSVTGGGQVTSTQAGIHCPGDCEESFVARSMVTLTAAETATTAFTGWTGACSGTQTTCSVFIDDAKSAGASFVSDFPLTVHKSGNGTATVTTLAGGLSCGATCSVNLPVRSVARVSVMPDPDSYLVYWQRVGCNNQALVCEITMTGPVDLDIELAKKPVLNVTITGNGRLTSIPAGVDCRASCFVALPIGLVQLTPVADAGWHFARFEGLCANQGSVGSCSHYMDADVAVSAIFERDAVRVLTLARAGDGSGSIASSSGDIHCPSGCTPELALGSVVTLTAAADGGSSFSGWSGACSGPGNCVLTMNGDLAVTATFTRQSGNGGNSSGGSSGGGGRFGVPEILALGLLVLRRRRPASTERFVQ